MSAPRVLNIRDLGRVGTWPADVRRIDRRTPFGNPFRLDDPWLVRTYLGYDAAVGARRAAAVALYRAWMLREEVTLASRFDPVGTLSLHIRALPKLPPRPDLEPLRGFRLACWDAPLACHGDVIVEILDGLAAYRPDVAA
jgi:hypothetical protein